MYPEIGTSKVHQPLRNQHSYCTVSEPGTVYETLRQTSSQSVVKTQQASTLLPLSLYSSLSLTPAINRQKQHVEDQSDFLTSVNYWFPPPPVHLPCFSGNMACQEVTLCPHKLTHGWNILVIIQEHEIREGNPWIHGCELSSVTPECVMSRLAWTGTGSVLA